MFGSQILPSWETQWLDFKLIYDQEINVVVVSICILNISFFFFFIGIELREAGTQPSPSCEGSRPRAGEWREPSHEVR